MKIVVRQEEMKNDIKEKQKEIINSKRIETISSLFNIAKSNYESLYQRIEELSVLIEAYSNLFCVEEKFKVENEYKYLKSTVEQISNSLDDYLIVPANNYLKNDQKVYIEELDEILVAVSKPLKGLESIIEGFTWNAAKQGGLVGVFFVHYGFYEELNQRVLELEQQVKEQRLKWSFENLSFLEQEALKIIIVENGIFQNYLWRKLQIDSRKCSRIINRLLEENLIIREPAVSNGARSYFLKVND